MKTLLILVIVACFCLAPAVTLAGNINPIMFLEIYTMADDPDDPGPPPSYLCYHDARPLVGEIQCYAEKVSYNFGLVPIHVGRLNPPISQGWPLPAGPGGGWVLVSYGLQRTGVTVTYVGISMCPNFLQGPGTAPGAILATATTQCHDWLDHACYAKFMSSTNVGATYFTIIGNLEDYNIIDLINCQAITENTILTVGGGAQWGGTKTLVCATDPIGTETTTWGAIKALYR